MGELSRVLTSVLGERSILAIEADALTKHIGARAIIEAPVPEEGGAIACDTAVEAALIGGLGTASAIDVARGAAAHCELVVFALPTARAGLKGLFGKMRRQRVVLLEELCEALLVAGLDRIEARELEGATGMSIVWGRARPDGG